MTDQDSARLFFQEGAQESGHQQRVREALPGIEADAIRSDELGRLTDDTARLINESGIMRLLANKDFGGYEAHPAEFIKAVHQVGAVAPSAAWVCGVVGVHPFEFGQCDPRLQEDIWGEDQTVWTGSPYAPQGRGRQVDGGYVLNGRWSFSTGCDQSDWFILGGYVVDDADTTADPPVMKHFVMPKSDVEILHDSWSVMGLTGTGSKDVVVRDVFIPEYRTIDATKIYSGAYAREFVPEKTLYKIPMMAMFIYAVHASSIGIAQGVIDRYQEYTTSRVSPIRGAAVNNPFQTRALGAVAADIRASKAHTIQEISDYYDYVKRGGEVRPHHSIELINSGVRATKRAYSAAFEAFQRAGGNAARLSNPVQRFWRDLCVGMAHGVNVDEPTHQDAGLILAGGEPVSMRR